MLADVLVRPSSAHRVVNKRVLVSCRGNECGIIDESCLALPCRISPDYSRTVGRRKRAAEETVRLRMASNPGKSLSAVLDRFA